MIELTRFNGSKFILNADLIESIEALPDTTIRTTNGKTYVSKDAVKDIVARIIEFRRLCGGTIRILPMPPKPDSHD